MTKYEVTIPIAGAMHCEVEVPEGTDADGIFEAATEKHSTDPGACEVEWEFHTTICQGNVLNVSTNEWEYQEIKPKKKGKP
jgi:hypothetical protein